MKTIELTRDEIEKQIREKLVSLFGDICPSYIDNYPCDNYNDSAISDVLSSDTFDDIEESLDLPTWARQREEVPSDNDDGFLSSDKELLQYYSKYVDSKVRLVIKNTSTAL